MMDVCHSQHHVNQINGCWIVAKESTFDSFQVRSPFMTQLLTDLLELIGCLDQALETAFEMLGEE